MDMTNFRNIPEAWIGYSDITKEGTWEWTNTPIYAGLNDIYKNWQSGEPNDQGGNADCAVLSKNGFWMDFTCTVKIPFICELLSKYIFNEKYPSTALLLKILVQPS